MNRSAPELPLTVDGSIRKTRERAARIRGKRTNRHAAQRTRVFTELRLGMGA